MSGNEHRYWGFDSEAVPHLRQTPFFRLRKSWDPRQGRPTSSLKQVVSSWSVERFPSSGRGNYLTQMNGLAGWWFQTWLLFSIWDVILPIDELIFSRWLKQPVWLFNVFFFLMGGSAMGHGIGWEIVQHIVFFSGWKKHDFTCEPFSCHRSINQIKHL